MQTLNHEGGLRILIADDNARTRLMLRATLADLQAEFIEIGGGSGVVQAVERYRPDWVLLEFRMEPVNGLVVASRIRKDFPSVRLVMVTNCDDPAVRTTATAVGIHHFVMKDDMLTVRKLIRSEAGPADRTFLANG